MIGATAVGEVAVGAREVHLRDSLFKVGRERGPVRQRAQRSEFVIVAGESRSFTEGVAWNTQCVERDGDDGGGGRAGDWFAESIRNGARADLSAVGGSEANEVAWLRCVGAHNAHRVAERTTARDPVNDERVHVCVVIVGERIDVEGRANERTR